MLSAVYGPGIFNSVLAIGIFNIPVPLPEQVKPEVQNNLGILRHIGFLKLKKSPAIYSDVNIRTKIDKLLVKMNYRQELPLILVKPGTRLEKWGWRLDKFKKLCNELIKTQTKEVLIICGPGEEKITMTIQTNHAPKSFPTLSLRELAYLIEKADLLICNHTGIMHLASAMKTPVLAIFKHGDPKRWGPYDTPHIILDERNHDGLTSETVFGKAQELLATCKNNRSHKNLLNKDNI